MSGAPTERERAFAERVKRLLGERAQEHADATLVETFRGLGPRRFRWPVVATALLVGAALAALTTWWFVSRSEAPMAFDGGVEASPAGPATVTRDAQGRLVEIATLRDGRPDGERVLFRAGRVVRIEHWSDGQLDGVATDFDGSGRATRIETWRQGRPAGPALDLDPELRPRREGASP